MLTFFAAGYLLSFFEGFTLLGPFISSLDNDPIFLVVQNSG